MTEPNLYRIVVGVDFTEAGDEALDQALRLSIPNEHDEVHAVYVIPHPSQKPIDKLSYLLDEARIRLRDRVLARGEAIGARGEQAIVFHVRTGEPATALHQVAVDVDADLMIVGTHQRGAVSKLMLGSVAEALVKTARLPILVARQKDLSGLVKTQQPDAATPGAKLHEHRAMSSEHVHFGKRNSHVSGLL